jgi:hypothetical protein
MDDCHLNNITKFEEKIIMPLPLTPIKKLILPFVLGLQNLHYMPMVFF